MTEDGDRRQSEQAQGPNGHPPENASDSGQSSVPWKSRSCLVRFLALTLLGAGFVGFIGAVVSQLESPEFGSEPPSTSSAAATLPDQAVASNEQPSESGGPIGGTWDMYVTSSEGNEKVAFVVRFMDDEYGTLEFPYDDKAYDGRWDINGDQISFGFARDFDGSGWGVTEWSSFEGTLVNANLITGNWFRDDWSCTPDDGCSTNPDPTSSDSRLVRNP